MPLVGVEPTISAGERPQAAHLLKSNIYDISTLRDKNKKRVSEYLLSVQVTVEI
jgi:hypothetical protein